MGIMQTEVKVQEEWLKKTLEVFLMKELTPQHPRTSKNMPMSKLCSLSPLGHWIRVFVSYAVVTWKVCWVLKFPMGNFLPTPALTFDQHNLVLSVTLSWALTHCSTLIFLRCVTGSLNSSIGNWNTYMTSEVFWARVVPAELGQGSAAVEISDKGKYSDTSWNPESIQTCSNNQTQLHREARMSPGLLKAAQSALRWSHWTSISLWHLTVGGHPCQAMEVGLSQSFMSCRLGKWICHCCYLGPDFILELITNWCITSLAPEKLQTLPQRQLCKTWEMVQMSISSRVKICAVLRTARIDQMDQALQSSH